MENQKKKYTLYTYFRSSTSWRVRIALHLKKIPVNYKFIHLVKGQQNSQQYKKINPNMSVPALQIQTGQVLFQSMAILDYLQQVHPQISLYPKNTFLKYKIKSFCQVINSQIHPYQNLKALKKIQEIKGDKMQWAKYWIIRGFQSINKQIVLENIVEKNKGKYCFGDQITMADVFMVPQVQGSVARFGINLQNFPNLKQILNRLGSQEAFIKAQPKNQPDFE